MRAVVQRVSEARVEVGGEVTGSIERGLLVYLGCGKEDRPDDGKWLLDKVLGLRIFPGEGAASEKMDASVLDVGGGLLVVSQFTLYGDVRKGRRPSFEGAMPPGPAEAAYDAFVLDAKSRGLPVGTGRFRADMRVFSVGVGPVTIWLDTASRAILGP